jgi:hypothetical protein
MLKTLTRSKFGGAVIVIAAILLIVFAGATGLPQSTYNPQWELRTAIVGLQNSPETPNWEMLASLGDVNRDGSVTQADVDLVVKALYSKPGDANWNPACDLNGNGQVDIEDLVTTTGHLGYTMFQGIYETSGVKVRHDFDVATWGLPDIEVTVSDVRKNDLKPFANKTIQGFNYELLAIEELFDVKIRTIADAVKVPSSVEDMSWWHETSMGFEWKTINKQGGEHIGQKFSGGAYVKFSCNPWGMEDYGVNPVTFKRFWYGLMNMKVESMAVGQANDIPENEIQHKGWARGLATPGDQLNMIPENPKLGGVYSPIPWDPQKILDPDTRASAIVYLPVDMFAGAKDTYDPTHDLFTGGITNVLPIDYYVIYTVRVEACLVREFGSSEEPNPSPNPSPLQPPKDYTPYTPATFWGQYGTWIIIAVIAFIVLALIGAFIFGGSILMMGMGGGM